MLSAYMVHICLIPQLATARCLSFSGEHREGLADLLRDPLLSEMTVRDYFLPFTHTSVSSINCHQAVPALLRLRDEVMQLENLGNHRSPGRLQRDFVFGCFTHMRV